MVNKATDHNMEDNSSNNFVPPTSYNQQSAKRKPAGRGKLQDSSRHQGHLSSTSHLISLSTSSVSSPLSISESMANHHEGQMGAGHHPTRLHFRVFPQTPTNSTSKKNTPSSLVLVKARDFNSTKERGDRKSAVLPTRERLLFQVLLDKEKTREMEASHGPQAVKQIHQKAFVQNVVPPSDSLINKRGRFSSVPQSLGRILSHPHSYKASPVPEVRGG